MKLIASWGSSGAGKTTVALGVAAALAKQNKDVLIISAESRTPSLPMFLPTTSGLTSKNSIAELLSRSEITEAQIKDRICKHPMNDHIYFMGTATGEIASITYGLPTREAVMNLIHLLQHSPFPYIIIDCDSNAMYDPMTLLALEWSNFAICTLTPDIKGFEFFKAQKAWLNSDTYKLEDFTCVLNPIHRTTSIVEARELFGKVNHTVPHSDYVREKMVAGEPLFHFRDNGGLEFERQMTILAHKIQEVSHG